ncbi:DUF1579 domain-containing protein [Flavobacterium capsici]|uniref:DUF1579 domain-containing protein n=1 Tax=Flavobacterium capsici TaxID=3075618 RepID=A0AA96F3G7_9FLAO|nr:MULTISPECIES: DUF1579 domain-containing protein [unclassified Flavobacterium]WNM18828.1 DUF1579 domain-containing protein [Flavobacterium sp. PMR2A8]WNM22879.1 DUF1579 domain-containing protein [Flavobacterium sp. PMTSA4]
MKFKSITLALAITCFISCKKEETKTETPNTETPKEEVAVTIPDSATIAKAWQDYATPGEQHKMLAKDSGVWEEEMTFWEHAGAEPSKMTMTAESKMIFDGKYQETTHKGDFYEMPFEGKSTLGYNNAEGKFISTWIDNMSTGISVLKGTYDPTTKTYTMSGEVFDPVTKKLKTSKEIVTIIDDNTQKMEMYDIGFDGKEFKNMEIIMKRKK